MNVLLLEDSNYTAALSIVRALGRLGHRVTTAAPSETPATCSRWCTDHVVSPPSSRPEQYSEFVRSVVHDGDYDLAFICDDPVIGAISCNRSALPGRPDFMLPPPESFEVARSKLESQRFAAKLGVPTPRTVDLDSPERLHAVGEELGFPFVIKDAEGFGARHVRYIADSEELREAQRNLATARFRGRPMAQEFVQGPANDVYMTQVLYRHGEPLFVCSHRKLRQFPPHGGTTARGATVDEPQLDAQVLRIFSALRWHGPAKADFKRDVRDGSFKLMELDPRVGASFEISMAAGSNLVDLCCRMVAGEPVQPQLTYVRGARMRLLNYDILSLAARPGLLPAFLLDTFNPRVRSDFDWGDMQGTWALLRRGVWIFDDALRNGRITGEAFQVLPAPSIRRSAHRLMLTLIREGFACPRGLYRAVQGLRRRRPLVGLVGADDHRTAASATKATGRRREGAH
jgi:predicted ATP-grasp superfamily ATP-dependent carboligase